MKYLIILTLLLTSCTKHATANPPVGGLFSKEDLQKSRDRTRNLNVLEKLQIQDWIKEQPEQYYPTTLNYWVDDKDLRNNTRKENGDVISYQYDIYDFDWVKLYNDPKKNMNVSFGHFEELKPVEDALRYMEKGQEVTLLIPSALAFGTYGDNNRISNDMPLIIKLKVL